MGKRIAEKQDGPILIIEDFPGPLISNNLTFFTLLFFYMSYILPA